MNKNKILKLVVLVLIIVIAALVIHTIRNYMIISDLQNKISEYSNSTNYHTRYVTTNDNGEITTMNYYKKDSKQVVFLERNLNGETSKISMYNNGERTDTFTETKDTKTAQLNSGTLMSVNIFNQLESESKWQTFIGSINAKVKLTDYNGKKCYIISKFISISSIDNEESELYIEKETGLLVKTAEGKIVSEREQEFNNVDDSIFIEPDIGEYTLK